MVKNDHSSVKISASEMLTQFRRKEILDAARNVSRAESFNGLTIDKVAERAGVSKGTIYTYFKDKASLVLDLIVDDTEHLIIEIAEAAEKTDSAEENLFAVADIMDRFINYNRDMVAYIHQPNGLKSCMEAGFGDKALELFKKLVSNVSSIFQRGLDSGEFHNANPDLMAVVFLSSMQNRTEVELFLPEISEKITAHAFLDVLLNGITKKGEK